LNKEIEAMKRVHILILLFVAMLSGVIFVALGNSDAYASFQQAEDDPERVFHVAGTLDLDKPMDYNPVANANLFSFHMTDRQGLSRKVVLHKPRPQDFDRSEQIVVIGKMQGSTFQAKDILTKCPSKYNDAPTQTVAN
jgi:cytochrome c-type biogenesis protein CcmE